MQLQSVIRAIYPAACLACDAPVEQENGLCASCWSETHFCAGPVCDACGAPLPGEDDGTVAFCDDCLASPRLWRRGRAVFAYESVGRRLVLSLKHGDRTDLVPTLARWMHQRVKDIAPDSCLVMPVPLHWSRLMRRRYNQAALLAQAISRFREAEVLVDGLVRAQRTVPLDGHSRDERFAVLDGAISAHPKRQASINGRSILLVDDVMTSGATLTAATEAVCAAGATDVFVVTLARVLKGH